MELLEDRVTPSAGVREQYMLELINRMRENPAAELPILLNSSDPAVNSALADFHVDRSVLQSQWNTLVPAPALAWNDNLAFARLGHDQAMLNGGAQSHQLPGEPDFGTCDDCAGYTNWTALAENIYAYAESIFHAHAGFAIDWGDTPTGIQTPPGHRINLMNPVYRDVGIGVLDNPTNFNNVGPILITQDFGTRFNYGNAYLVGLVLNDANHNNYYDQGEGIAGALVSITGPGGTFTTVSSIYGGYQIKLAPGAYTVTVSGAGILVPVVKSVTIGTSNLHVNFIKGALPHLDASLPFSDDFNRANGSFIGAYWTPVVGNFSTVNNAVVATDPGLSIATVNGLVVADTAVQADLTVAANQAVGLMARYQANGSFYLGMLLEDAAGASFTPYLFKYSASAGFAQIAVGPNVTASSGSLRFEVIGTSLKLFFGPDSANLALVAYGYDSTLVAGHHGVCARPRGSASTISRPPPRR